MKNLRLILMGCCLAVVSLWAADVSGKYSYEMTGRNGNSMTANLTLKADGDKLTGSVSGRGGDTDISDGKVSGDDVSFVVVREFNGNKITSNYKGKVVDADTIHFTVTTEGGPGGGRPREFDAKRAK
jgi:hypothetical protein